MLGNGVLETDSFRRFFTDMEVYLNLDGITASFKP